MTDSHKSYDQICKWGKSKLAEAGIEDADIDAWYLLEYVTGMSRTDFFLERESIAPVEKCLEYEKLIEKRASHIPLQHIIGTQEFMGLEFQVNGDVLVPRQDTECLVEHALPWADGRRVLDMCTGSGCIAVSLCKLGSPSNCVAVDLSEAALKVAKQNASLNGVNIEFQLSDMFQNVDGEYDLIVSNPPYIRPDVIETLSEEVRVHEPYMALCGGRDGLEFYRIIAEEGWDFLSEDGIIFVEIGHDQGEAVKEMFEAKKYENVVIYKDFAGNDRVVSAAKVRRK